MRLTSRYSNAVVSVLEKGLVGLKKYKEESDVAMKKLEKEMTELSKVVLAKKLAIDEFKAFDEYKEAVEGGILPTLARVLISIRNKLIIYFLTSKSMIYKLILILLTEMKTMRRKEKMCKMQLFLNSLSHLVSPCIFLSFVMATLVL